MDIAFIIFIVALAWIYDFYNGANDSANAIATTISTRVLTPNKAILLAAVLNFCGALFTTEVAKTIGKGLVPADLMTPTLVVCAVLSAILWAAYATHRGIPVSITHCIVGGILGSGIAAHGIDGIQWSKMNKIFIGMVASPLGGFIIGFIMVIGLLWLFRKSHPGKAQSLMGKSQLVSASFMAFTHGMNDAQNAMGIITIALLSSGFISSFEVPFWVMASSALFMGLGTYYGGRKVIHTMGNKIVKIKPMHGFAAETTSGGVILVCSLMGIPISTTHVISTAIMGVGSVKRFSAVRWGIVKHIVITWILTIPIAGAIGALLYYLIQFSSKILGIL